MAIPASDLVKITPRVLSGTGQDLVFNGLLITDNEIAPAKGLLTFYNPEDVAAYFGETSEEYTAARVYFQGYNNSLTKPQSVFFYRENTAGAAAFYRGGRASLDAIQDVTAGTFNVKIGTEEIALTALDFSAVTSFSDAATVLQTAIRAAGTGTAVTAATVTYSSINGAFTLTAGTEATGVNVDNIDGTAADALGFGNAGATVSPGADAQTWAGVLSDIASQSQNWATFTTIKEITAIADAQAISEWVQTRFALGAQFMWAFWSTDAAVTSAQDTSSVFAQLRETSPEGIALVYGTLSYAAFILGAAASIAWDSPNSTITLAFKAQSGLGANVQDQSIASALIANRINFMGNYATRNDNFILLQPGAILGGFRWIDTYLNSTWLNSALQTQILAGFQMSPRVPYTEEGYTLIRAWVQDVADRAINNGVIDLGVQLSEAQKSEIMRETGGIDISTELYNSGYFLQIVDAPAVVRQARTSPACNFWYSYGGSVHKINLPSTAVV